MIRNAAVATARANAAPLADAPLELDLEMVRVAPLRVEAPGEEFRTLRTRLEQFQAPRIIQTILLASPSPGDGKSYTAANLGLAEAQLADNPTLLCDFDLRNPILHKVFRVDRAPGISDYLLGKADLHETLRRIGGSNLFVMPAGDVAVSPLELLHLKEVRKMMGRLRTAFRRILLDSPALLVASDASLLAALADGTLLIGRIGGTNRDSMRRAIETLGQDNILGIVANSARRP